MRGSPLADLRRFAQRGIIPAHAGLTSSRRPRPPDGRDHPRACGAHNHNRLTSYTVSGSSPRMRGSRMTTICEPSSGGIIPAHAGLTDRDVGTGVDGRDHPRACGAHKFCAALLPAIYGIIPAHAGLTCSSIFHCGSSRDHPRACGAHASRNIGVFVGGGSSPRMRGSLDAPRL